MNSELGQRIGCRNCDFVSRIEGTPATEDWLHEAVCPSCGEAGDMHAYPIPGTWPSETPPPCREAETECRHARTAFGWGDEVRCLDCGSTLAVADG